jgi:hypothetical protein
MVTCLIIPAAVRVAIQGITLAVHCRGWVYRFSTRGYGRRRVHGL